MIDLISFLKVRYLILFAIITVSFLVISNYIYNNQKDLFTTQILIKPVPLYDNIFYSYEIFDKINFTRSKLNSNDMISLFRTELQKEQMLIDRAEEMKISSDLLSYPEIIYPRVNPAEGIPEGSIILRVESTSQNNIKDYLVSLIRIAEENSKDYIYFKFEEYLSENEYLKKIELDKIKLSIKKIITLFESEMRDIENEITLSKDLGFETPVISQNLSGFVNNYMSGSIVLERRVSDIKEAKSNITDLLYNLENEPVESVVYSIVHEFARYVDKHSAFSTIGGRELTNDLINFEIYHLINNSTNIEQAIEILKRSDFHVARYNESGMISWNMKKSIRSYYVFVLVLSIFLTLLLMTILEIRMLRKNNQKLTNS